MNTTTRPVASEPLRKGFAVYLINMGYYLPAAPGSLTEALGEARRAGFEASILRDGCVVASWHPISGTRMH